MKVSTKGRYALRFLINIASRTDGKPVSIKDVAAQEEISEKYLEQITSVLNSGGLVKSTRGPQGCCWLCWKSARDFRCRAAMHTSTLSAACV